MIQQQVNLLNNFRMVLDALMVIGAGYASCYVNWALAGRDWKVDTTQFLTSVLVVMFVNNYVVGGLGLYSDRRPGPIYKLFYRMGQAVVVDFAILAGGIFVYGQSYPRGFFIFFALICFVFLVSGRLLLRFFVLRIAGKNKNARKILVVGSMTRGKIVCDLLDRQLSWGHEVVGKLITDPAGDNGDGTVLGMIDELPVVLKKHTIDEVIFAIGSEERVPLGPHLDFCRKIGVPFRILPSLWQPGVKSLAVESCQGVPFLIDQTEAFNATGVLYKRILDLLGGLVGSLLFLLIYPVVALAIKRESPGPVLFKQRRVGQNGRIFELYKFRSMGVDAEAQKKDLLAQNEMDGAMFKLQNDPRVTKVGAWLRKTSIDEIPQFLNVLKGEMSLVGTRPPTLDEVEEYQAWQLRRISAKPGMTGLWQVSGRSRITDFNKIVELDCSYYDNWKFSDDIIILLKTIVVVLRRKGAI